jgi:hypothetical protein
MLTLYPDIIQCKERNASENYYKTEDKSDYLINTGMFKSGFYQPVKYNAGNEKSGYCW